MHTKIQKWGNSLGLRIPKAIAEAAGVSVGSAVNLTVEDGRLVVRPRRPVRVELAQLLEAVTAENIHEEVETGGSQGRERW